MKHFPLIVYLITICGCSNEKEYKDTIEIVESQQNSKREFDLNDEIEQFIIEVDSNIHHGNYNRVIYPDKTAYGALRGYFDNETLVFIEGHYGAELGYKEWNIYLKDSKAIKYRIIRHTAEWEKFRADNGSDDYCMSEMTYADTIQEAVMFNNPKFIKSSKGKIVSTRIDKEFIQNMVEADSIMRTFLDQLEPENKKSK